MQIRLDDIDLPDDFCGLGDVDGNGKIAIFCNAFGSGGGIFLADSADGRVSGPFAGSVSAIAGQASGFIAADCTGGDCFIVTYGVSDSGQTTFRRQGGVARSTRQVNNPIGGVVRADFGNSDGKTVTIESFDASGTLRWARGLPEPVDALVLGVDRGGNLLSLWNAPGGAPRSARNTRGQWLDPAGNAGPVFVAFAGRQFALRLFERVGGGLFIDGTASFDGGKSFNGIWVGQLDPFSTVVAAPPAWLAARPDASLHMAHGGTAYAVIAPAGPARSTCERIIEVFSPSGHRCGAATFAVGGAACTPGDILVGYDGTVVQELPASCAAEHSCTLRFQDWKDFFR